VSRPDKPDSVYLDSCGLIYVLTRYPGYEPIERLLALSDAGQLTIMISPLSLVEVRGQGRASFDAAKDKQARSLVDNPRFLMIEFDREVAVKARDMVRRFKLKNFDAIHLASAVVGQADTLMTYDKGFPQGQSVDGVWVDEPYTYGGPDLFTDR